MFRFSASSRQVQSEEVEDVLKTWGKLALAGIFLTGSLLLPHADAKQTQNLKNLSHYQAGNVDKNPLP